MHTEKSCLLRIFTGENEHKGHQPLHQWILTKARDFGLAGASAWRGMAGFGAHRQMHTVHVLRLADHLPIVVEIVDQRTRLLHFLEEIEDVLPDCTATLENIEIIRTASAASPKA